VGTPLTAAEEPLERVRRKLKLYDWRSLGEDAWITVTIGAAAFIPAKQLKV
jgi:hypothetical protein